MNNNLLNKRLSKKKIAKIAIDNWLTKGFYHLSYNFEMKWAENGQQDIPSATLTAGKVYTIWAKGLAAGTGDTHFSGQVTTNR